MQPNEARWGSVRWLPVINIGGEDAPAWGVLDVVKTRVVHEQTVFEIQKPAVANTRCVMFNGPTVIKAGKPGWATIDFPCQVLCESNVADLDPLAVQIKAGDDGWKLRRGATPGQLQQPTCFYYYYCMGDGGISGTRYIDLDPCPEDPQTTTLTVITSIECQGSNVIGWESKDLHFPLCGHSVANTQTGSCTL